MKRNIKLTSLIVLCTFNFLIGQKNIDKRPNFFIYRTESDFFNKKETLFGKSEYKTELIGSIDYFDLNNIHHKNINLSDSNIYGFKIEHIPVGQVVPRGESFKPNFVQYIKIGKNHYAPFCGGNKDYFITSALMGSGTFDADGFVNNDFTTYGNNSEYGTNYIEFWFHNRIKNISTKNIEEVLADDPTLMEKYTSEKNETDKKVWKRYKFFIGIKYFKLYIKAHSK